MADLAWCKILRLAAQAQDSSSAALKDLSQGQVERLLVASLACSEGSAPYSSRCAITSVEILTSGDVGDVFPFGESPVSFLGTAPPTPLRFAYAHAVTSSCAACSNQTSVSMSTSTAETSSGSSSSMAYSSLRSSISAGSLHVFICLLLKSAWCCCCSSRADGPPSPVLGDFVVERKAANLLVSSSGESSTDRSVLPRCASVRVPERGMTIVPDNAAIIMTP